MEQIQSEESSIVPVEEKPRVTGWLIEETEDGCDFVVLYEYDSLPGNFSFPVAAITGFDMIDKDWLAGDLMRQAFIMKKYFS